MLNNLIKNCICGNESSFEKLTINNVKVLKCNICGVMHQEIKNWNSEDYLQFYKDQYHKDYQEKKGIISYYERYEHDCQVSNLRLDAYKKYLHSHMIGLDIGSSNSAFVHQARSRGFNCVGLEPGKDIGDDSVTIRGTLDDTILNNEYFDFVTMHDSIEHIVDVNNTFKKINIILKPNRYLILDLPDYFIPAGQHHWKYIEHIWFFNKTDMEMLLGKFGFNLLEITQPIPGKLVFYSQKI